MALIPMSQALQQQAKNQIQNSGSISSTPPSGLPEVSREEANLIAAASSERIEKCTKDQIGQVLSTGLLKLGLKAANTDPTILIAAEQDLRRNNGFLRLQELTLAFDMAAREQLDFNPQTFQNFSILYLNQLVNAYKRWAISASEFLQPHITKINAQKQLDYSPYIYPKSDINHIRKEIQEGLEAAQKGFIPSVAYIPYEWYNILVLDKYIVGSVDTPENKKVKDLTDTERENLLQSQNIVFEFLGSRREPLYVQQL